MSIFPYQAFDYQFKIVWFLFEDHDPDNTRRSEEQHGVAVLLAVQLQKKLQFLTAKGKTEPTHGE